MTKERPILFSGPMVSAILDGRKSQTRRLVRTPRRGAFAVVGQGEGWWPFESDDGESIVCNEGNERPIVCPYGVPGDRLWVKETWKSSEYRCSDEPQDDDHECSAHCSQTYVYYRATPRVGYRPRPDRARIRYLDEISPLTEWYEKNWHPSIHMPRWASRVTLEVTSVCVERLQAITEEDARAEGVLSDADQLRALGHLRGADAVRAVPSRLLSARQHFSELWDSINGERAPWSSNPWVWVVSFRRLP